MKYTSLHNYLDQHLGDNASDSEIKHVKAEYWKWYRREHRKKRTQEMKALNLTISIVAWKKLKDRAREAGMNTYDFIKYHLELDREPYLQMNVEFSIEIMKCFELLKDYMDGDITIEQVYSYMENLIAKL